ncbi:hypothetical protein TanjilG_24142 [Lupinus angustifolius]|uniref:AB hydrolase-1 domain-containing protein n=1 Tax=Lupinus angustifolius TaxID=3871 RepID=A0A1J7GU07_LUPAN|nr:hypothetical protein TanjilG_24142 [Lupinus angustifolius]
MVNPIAVAIVVIVLRLAYKALKPPPPKTCGSVGGPPLTSPRVKLSDGRHLAYREFGVPKLEAKYKIIVIHGFHSSKDINLPLSQEFVEDLGIYFLFFDRAGLCGAALVVPFVSYWWPSFPANISREALQMLPKPDQWTFRVAHYASWLFYWWMTQKWFPSLTFGNTETLSADDLEIIKSFPQGLNTAQEKITQQGEHESLHRDIVSGFGEWEFSPTDILNPFPNKEGSVHIWQGYEDRIIPYTLNRFISHKLPWIHYHELSDGGHMFIFKKKHLESIITELLLS